MYHTTLQLYWLPILRLWTLCLSLLGFIWLCYHSTNIYLGYFSDQVAVLRRLLCLILNSSWTVFRWILLWYSVLCLILGGFYSDTLFYVWYLVGFTLILCFVAENYQRKNKPRLNLCLIAFFTDLGVLFSSLWCSLWIAFVSTSCYPFNCGIWIYRCRWYVVSTLHDANLFKEFPYFLFHFLAIEVIGFHFNIGW